MKLELYFSDEEIDSFLMGNGYVPFTKKEVIYHGPYDKLKDVVVKRWVRGLDGSEFILEDKFNELIKKKLLT